MRSPLPGLLKAAVRCDAEKRREVKKKCLSLEIRLPE